MNTLLLLVVIVSHPGGLDSSGGHHDRKKGGYHSHRGGGGADQSHVPQPLFRSAVRTIARSEPRLLAREESRIEEPKGRSVAPKTEEVTRTVPAYEVIERASSPFGPKLKVAFKELLP